MRRLSLLFFLSIFFICACKDIDADLIINNAEIYNGKGTKPYYSSIGIKDGLIIKIGANLQCENCKTIDANGMALSPGFIDLHAHLEPLPLIPDAESALRMGVTTGLGGPDGSSPLKIGKYLDSLESLQMGINVAYLIGHNSIRLEVLQMDDRMPNELELKK